MPKVIALHSGGMDSTVALQWAITLGATEVISLGVIYGSRHNEAEALAALNIVGFYRQVRNVDIQRRQIVLPSDIFHSGRSALMNDIEMPKLSYHEIAEWKGESPTVVPFRNAVLISLAAALAESQGFDTIVAGMHSDDGHNFNYPDCTQEFLGSMASAVYVGTYHRVRLEFPLVFSTKATVCRMGMELRAPMHLSWSCYAPVRLGRDEYVHCGVCPTCIERHQAYRLNGYNDPTIYNTPPRED